MQSDTDKKTSPTMHGFLNTFRALLLLAILGPCYAVKAQETGSALEPAAESLPPKNLFGGLAERVRFSGFARLVGGYLDAGEAHYQGYNDAISFGQHSLLALQTDVELTKTLSFTTQLLAHASAARKSGVEWAYLSWQPSRSWNFKAGRMRTPFYLHSATIDVGFSYPWIIPPQPVYTPYVLPNFTGLSAAYRFNIRDWGVETKAYWGNFAGYMFVEDETPAYVKTKNLRGLVLEAQRGNLRLRASWHRGVGEVSTARLVRFTDRLRQFGFSRSLASLNTKTSVTYIKAGVSYEALDYYLKAEWTRLRKGDAYAVPAYDGYYLSGGYTFYPFNLPITAHATYARHHSERQDRRPVDEIPRGTRLRAAYNAILNSRLIGDDSMQSLGVGLRWDVSPAVALKAEWLHIDGERDKRSFFTVDPATDFDRGANLFLLALEWIF